MRVYTVKGSGTVNLQFLVDGKVIHHKVQNVLHTPNFNSNLLSMGRLDAAGISWSGGDGKLVFKQEVRSQIWRMRSGYLRIPGTRSIENTAILRTAASKSLSDVWGPANVESIGHAKYYISFTDHFTRRCSIRFLKTKDEAYQHITEHLAQVKMGSLSDSTAQFSNSFGRC